MCGFGGVINFKRTISAGTIRETAGRVSFRGPDSTGIRMYDELMNPADHTGNVGLFFNRLAIIDLDHRSDQPFENERYVLQFNGEIYNYKELRSGLEQEGTGFVTSSDTEVLFHLLIKYGTRAIAMLNGMFAFCFIDKSVKTVLLARDRSGIKPACYHISRGEFVFASEADSVVNMMENRPSVDAKAIALYLGLQYIPTPFTIWQGVRKLPPGAYLETSFTAIEEGRSITPVVYWNAYDQASHTNDGKQELERLLQESIRSQLQADVPLGVFLSSGIDSSLLAAMINRHFSNGAFNFFTVSFEGNEGHDADEYSYARDFLNGFHNGNFTHHVLKVSSTSVRDGLNDMYRYLDEPFGDYAVMLNHAISQKARDHVTVALSGDGSDELFWGYPRYNQWRTDRIGAGSKLGFIGGIAKWLPEGKISKKLSRKFPGDPVQAYLNIIGSGHFDISSDFMDESYWWYKGSDRLKDRDDLPSLVDFKTYLADCMFYKVDRSSMGASLEVRVPFVDNEIIGYALRLKLQEKSTSQYSTKSPLKSLLAKLAPHYRFDLPKRGFSLPLKEWINTTWKDMVLSSDVAGSLDAFDMDEKYQELLHMHYKQGKDQSLEIWRMLNLALWYNSKK